MFSGYSDFFTAINMHKNSLLRGAMDIRSSNTMMDNRRGGGGLEGPCPPLVLKNSIGWGVGWDGYSKLLHNDGPKEGPRGASPWGVLKKKFDLAPI